MAEQDPVERKFPSGQEIAVTDSDRLSLPQDLTRAAVDKRLKAVVWRSRVALFWERLWPALYLPFILLTLFAGLSLAGTWLVVPVWLRLVLVAALAGAFLWSLRPLLGLRWPSRQDALHRVELVSGLSNRPLTAIEDDLPPGSASPETLALWEMHKRRMAETLRSMRSGLAHPEAFRRDPYALRVVALMLLVTGFAVTQDGTRLNRLGSAFTSPLDLQEVASRIDAWVTPPLYTARAPIYLTGESAALRDPSVPLKIPAGSVLTLRAQGTSGLAIYKDGEPVTPAQEDEPAAAQNTGVEEQRLTLSESGSYALQQGGTVIATWPFDVQPDLPPTIRLLDDPEAQLSGALKLSYLAQDDYRVTGAEAQIEPAPKASDTHEEPRPLVEAPQFPLSVPPQAPGSAKPGETIRDLTSHPWAGSEVLLTLIARDEAGQTGTSEPAVFTLPQRRFSKPLAKAVVEQRRDLALDAKSQLRVIDAFDALLLAPEAFDVQPRVHLGLAFAYRNLVAARSDEQLKELLPLLWDLALSIEDGDLSMAERALRDAQEALREALEEGASDEEIARLTQELRQALQEYMQALTEQLRQNPQAMQPFNPNQQSLSTRDLDEMLRRIEELARSGSRDAARDLLAQMQRMLENLQTGRPQMAPDGLTNEMMEMLNQLGQMIQRQQELMDQTHRFNQQQQQQGEGEGGQQGGQNGGQGQQMTEEQLRNLLDQLQQGQGDLAQQLQQLMEQMERNGLSQNEGLGEAGDAMGQAQRSLGQGQGDQAVGQQGDALDALRRGAQQLGEQMMGMGEGQGMSQRSPMDTDPLGRPRRNQGPDLGSQVKVPDEIDVQRARRILEELRRRFSDPARPRLELDYLERLLRSY